MSRRSPRVRVRFAATVQIAGVDHTLICHTRDISARGCFLDTSEVIAEGVPVSMSVMDNARGEVVSVEGEVARVVAGEGRGIGVKIDDPPDGWLALVDRFQLALGGHRPSVRLNVLVVSEEANRRGALALYVTSGWDVRFAVDLQTATEALGGVALDAVIAEMDLGNPMWRQIMEAARREQPRARRLVRTRLSPAMPEQSGGKFLAHRFVDVDAGLDALLDALTAEMDANLRAALDPISGASPLGNHESRSLLRGILQRARELQDAIVVFDLDSTLLDNSPRQAKILCEYGEELSIDVLAKSSPDHWTSWDVGDAMANAGLAPELVLEHREPFKGYWRDRFFTSEYCVLDEAIEGAAEFVQAVRDHGGRVFYVTGRHEEMRRGSVESLRRLGFPVPDGHDVHLLMKPTLIEDDDEYKARTFETLRKSGIVVAAFDNEPTHINGYRSAFPDASSVHLATDHSMRPVRITEGIPSIADFSAFRR